MNPKEYKYNILGLISFYYVPVLIVIGVLIYLGTMLNNFRWVVLSFPVVIFIVCVYFFIRQMRTKYVIKEECVEIIYSEKSKVLISFEDLVTIRRMSKSIEVSYRVNNKIKTHYFNWLLKEYEEFKNECFDKLKQSKHYNEVIFVD